MTENTTGNMTGPAADRQAAAAGQIPRQEAAAFLDSLDGVSPRAWTPCAGWTVHELTAHVASGADGLADQVEAYLNGDPIPVLEPWPQREARLAENGPDTLRRKLLAAEQRMTATFSQMRWAGHLDPVPGVGFGFPIEELILHMRQEFAVHRFDLGVDDERGARLLGQPELLSHSVRMLSQALLAAGSAIDPSLRAVLRTPGSDDLLVEMGSGQGSLTLLPADAEPDPSDLTITCAAGDRLLLLWGRQLPDGRLQTSATRAAVDRLRGRLGF